MIFPCLLFRKVKVEVNVSKEVRDIKNVIGCIKGDLEPGLQL